MNDGTFQPVSIDREIVRLNDDIILTVEALNLNLVVQRTNTAVYFLGITGWICYPVRIQLASKD